MKTEIEKKLNKLPDIIVVDDVMYDLNITKRNDGKQDYWWISYNDMANNSILVVEHCSIQAAIDTTLKELKQWK